MKTDRFDRYAAAFDSVGDAESAGNGVADIFGSWNAATTGPQAFAVRVPSGASVRAHFHSTAQFQVFFGTDAYLGRTPLRSTVVQYADAWAPYGPFGAGTDPLVFLTLRAEADVGVHYMPESRAEQVVRGGRQMINFVDGAAAAARREVVTHVEDADGLNCWEVDLAPGERLDRYVATVRGGQYWVVLDGALSGADELPPRSIVWLAPGEDAAAVIAGASGCRLVGMQFPSPGPR